ncbi:hypothetical protein XENOCAPTIV_012110, partial [Xenoophorus captivus]
RDPILAKQLFSSLFAGILHEMDQNHNVQESGRIKEELRFNMNTFLNKSTLCFPPFIACVQDMCYQQRELQQLDPAAISSTCRVSLQQPSGILLLEEGLLQAAGPEEPPAKRSRGRKEIPPDTNKWIHLARLYRDLEDYDVVRGIFGGKVGTKSITSAALQAEANTDFAEAVKLYNEVQQLADTYLQHMIRSMLKQLQLGESDQTLLSFIDKAMRVEERKKLLESKHSQELSLLYILQEDYDRAKYYTNYAMQLFMEVCPNMCFFLDKIREKLRGPAPSDSIEVDGGQDPAGDIETIVNDCKFSMKLHMADSACQQKNFPVATKLLKELHKEAKTNRGWLLRWVHCFSSYNHKRSPAQGPVDQIASMLKTIPLLGTKNNTLLTCRIFSYLSQASCYLLFLCRGA